MANYRYIFADLLTNKVNMELPLFGVTFNRIINQPGNFQGFFALGNEGLSDQDILDATLPGRTAIYVERTNSAGDSDLIWGGILWSRTWQEQALSMQFTGQTFESFFYKEDIRSTIVYVNVDQRNVLRNLITAMQAYAYRNIGITVPSAFANSILRSVTFNNYEVWTFGKAIEYMIEYDQGFDYTIECRYDTNGNPSKTLRTDNVLGSPIDTSQLVFDYPGSIKNFWLPENAAKGATTVHGIGAGEGSAMPRIVQTNQHLLDVGYPELVEVYTNKDVTIANTLASQTVAALAQLTVPISVPTFEINPSQEPEFGSYSLGDYAKFNIESKRYPGGKVLSSRILGWDVSPTESDNQENVKLVIEGEDSGV